MWENRAKIKITLGLGMNLFISLFVSSVLQGQDIEVSIQTGHPAPVQQIRFSSDGTMLAAFDLSNAIIIWDITTKRQMKKYEYGHAVNKLLFTPCNNYLVVNFVNGQIQVIDIASNIVVAEIVLSEPAQSWGFFGDKNQLFVASSALYKIEIPSGNISNIANSPFVDIKFNTVQDAMLLCAENRIVCMNINGVITDTLPLVVSSKYHRSMKQLLRMENKKLKIVTDSTLQKNNFWSERKYNIAKTKAYSYKKRQVRKYSKSNIERIYYSQQFDKIAFKSNRTPGFRFELADFPSIENKKYCYQNYTDQSYTDIVFAAKHNKVIACNDIGEIYVYNYQGKLLRKWRPHIGRINCVDISPDQSVFATAGDDRSIMLWDTDKLHLVCNLQTKSFPLACPTISFDGRTIAFGDDLGFVNWLNFSSPDLKMKSIRVHDNKVSDIQFQYNDSILYSVGRDDRVCRIDANEMRVLNSMKAEGKIQIKSLVKNVFALLNLYYVPELSVSHKLDIDPAGETVLLNGGKANSRDFPTILMDAKSLKQKAKLFVHEGSVFNSVSNNLVTASRSRILRWKINQYGIFYEGTELSEESKVVEIRQLKLFGKDIILFVDGKTIFRYQLNDKKLDAIASDPDSPILCYDFDKTTNQLGYLTKSKLMIVDMLSKKEQLITQHEGNYSEIAFHESKNWLFIACNNASIQIWDMEKLKLVMTIIGIDHHPVFITPENYYFLPGKDISGIGYTKGKKCFSPEQFDLKYNRPDIVLSKLGYVQPELIEAYHSAYLKRLKKMGFTEEDLGDDFHLPESQISNFETLPVYTEQKEIELDLNFNDSKYKLDRFDIWINNVPIMGEKGYHLKDKSINTHSQKVILDLASGTNKIQVGCLNEKGAESLKETVEITYVQKQPTKPDLYLLSIGTSDYADNDFDLTYAHKDALDLAELLKTDKNVYGHVNVKTLINEQVTAENIKAAREFLEQAGRDDVVIVFIAGHGMLDDNYDYYFGTHDINFYNPAEGGILYSDVEALLDGLKALKKILLMDTCNSGEVDEDEIANNNDTIGEAGSNKRSNGALRTTGANNMLELMKELFVDLRRGTGATVISSAGGMQAALESTQWKNGLFTYCILESLRSKKADLDKNGEIMLSELQQFVREKVLELSGGIQKPTFRIENIEMDFRVW